MHKNEDKMFSWYIMSIFNPGSFSLNYIYFILAFPATYLEKKVAKQNTFNSSNDILLLC